MPLLNIEASSSPSYDEEELRDLKGLHRERSPSPRACGGASCASLGAVTSLTPSWGPRPTSPREQQPGRAVAPVTEKRVTGGGSQSRCCSSAHRHQHHRDRASIRFEHLPTTTSASDMVRAFIGKINELVTWIFDYNRDNSCNNCLRQRFNNFKLYYFNDQQSTVDQDVRE